MKEMIFGGQKIVTGIGSLEYVKTIKNERVFIVTGASAMIKCGAIDYLKTQLKQNSCEVLVHFGVKSNPDTEDVEKGLKEMNNFNPTVVIAIGGGSPIDMAKTTVVLYENKEITLENIYKVKLPDRRTKVKFIAVPSTSGTGTEVTKSSVITFRDLNLKIGLKCDAFIPDVAILDPKLTLTMPDHIVAETGMDALTHAVECYINNNLDDYAEILAKGAVEGIFKYLPLSYIEKSIEYREKIHNYQCMAGMAFCNVGLGMAHGISHAMGAEFNLGHGLSNAIVLPYVLEYNSKDRVVNEKLSKLSKVIGKNDFTLAVRELNHILDIPTSFKEAHISETAFMEKLDELTANSLKGSTVVNPVKISEEEMKNMLVKIFFGK